MVEFFFEFCFGNNLCISVVRRFLNFLFRFQHMWHFRTLHILLLSIFFLLGVLGRTFVRIAGAVVCLSGLGLLLFLVLHFSFLYWLLLCNVYEYELWKLQSHNDKDNDQRTRAWVFKILTVAFGTIFCWPFFVIRSRILKLSWEGFLLIFGGGVSACLQAIFEVVGTVTEFGFLWIRSILKVWLKIC